MQPPTVFKDVAVEIQGEHIPACNPGCTPTSHRMLSDREAAWFAEHPEGEE